MTVIKLSKRRCKLRNCSGTKISSLNVITVAEMNSFGLVLHSKVCGSTMTSQVPIHQRWP